MDREARPRWRAVALAVGVLALVAGGGCVEDAAVVEPQVCSRELRTQLWGWSPAAWDILIVVDRSPSMARQAAALAETARWLGAQLELLGDPPDLHLAVVSSDLGGRAIAGCDAGGHQGRFEGAAHCGLADGYLRWARWGLAAGQNFVGSLGAATECLLDLPLSTCPLTQPLAAAVRALDGGNPGNDGFRRPGASLLVVFLTDGDDCSLLDPDALAASGWPLDSEAAVDFACFAAGTVCTPDEPAAPGVHQRCGPRPGRLADPARTRAVLGDRSVFVAAARGLGAVEVLAGPALASTPAGPSPRLAALGGSASDVTAPTGDLLSVIASLLGPIPRHCLSAAVDLEPTVPGVQARCERRLWWPRGWPPAQALPWCGAVEHRAGEPCVRLAPDQSEREGCEDGAVAVAFEPGSAPLAPAPVVELRCELPCP